MIDNLLVKTVEQNARLFHENCTYLTFLVTTFVHGKIKRLLASILLSDEISIEWCMTLALMLLWFYSKITGIKRFCFALDVNSIQT
jgi:hypothetical protein